MLNSISRLGETRPEQEWPNGTEFSGYSDIPENALKTYSSIFENFSRNFYRSFHSVSDRKSRDSNGKRPRKVNIFARKIESLGTSLSSPSHQSGFTCLQFSFVNMMFSDYRLLLTRR